MGFRCPKCKKDFGSNKDDFQKHLLECTGNTLNEYAASALVNSEEQAKQTYVRSMLDCITKEEQEHEDS